MQSVAGQHAPHYVLLELYPVAIIDLVAPFLIVASSINFGRRAKPNSGRVLRLFDLSLQDGSQYRRLRGKLSPNSE